MEPLSNYSEEFFNKYKEKPEELFEYGPEIQAVADKYINKIRQLLIGVADVEPIGSVAYKMPAADVEVAVYTTEDNFIKAVEILENKFGEPVQKQLDFVRFQIIEGKYEMNVHVYKGREAVVNKSLTKYMLDHPDLIDEYKKIKEKHSYSKREYQLQKYFFINKVIKEIPEDYI